MKSLLLVLISFMIPALARPGLSAKSEQLAPPFKIIISTPSLPMFAPIFLASNGSTTTDKSLAALCYIASSTELFCGNNTFPIGARLGASATLFSAIRASEQASHVGMGGGELVTKGFSIDKDLLRVKWDNKEFDSKVEFVYRLDGSQSVWAVFGHVSMVDSVGAELLAIFD